ncbi:hypothetical protein EXW51_30540 (plasmid) [Bacillus mycoides]|nr:hypothetical protein EXW51_30540 [Bacillus mycoides]
MSVEFPLNLATNNDNYVNELSIWAAHCIFCLACFFSKMLAVPYAYQAKIFNYPPNEKFISLQSFMKN